MSPFKEGVDSDPVLLPHLGRPFVSVGKQPAGNDFMSQNSFALFLTISVFYELLETRFDADGGVDALLHA